MEQMSIQKEFNQCNNCNVEIAENEKICLECKTKIIAKPWTRWAARLVDFIIFGSLLWISISLIFIDFLSLPIAIQNIILSFLYIFLESAMLVIWGTTPGKSLMNTKLIPLNQKEFTFGLAFKRSFLVWIYGYGLGIPLLAAIESFIWLGKLKKDGITTWDKKTNIAVIHNKNSKLKVTLAILIILINIIISFYSIIAYR